MSPSVNSPNSLFNSWGGPIDHYVSASSIVIDMYYVPPAICPTILMLAHDIKGLARIATSGVGIDELIPPIEQDAANIYCNGKQFLRFIFFPPAILVARCRTSGEPGGLLAPSTVACLAEGAWENF